MHSFHRAFSCILATHIVFCINCFTGFNEHYNDQRFLVLEFAPKFKCMCVRIYEWVCSDVKIKCIHYYINASKYMCLL